MNSYERLMARIHGEEVDRIPNLCILMAFAAKYAHTPYRDFCLSPEKMVEANLLCHEKFDIDIVTVMSDPYGEAMDYGMQVEFPPDGHPHAVKNFWRDDEEPSADSLPIRSLQDTKRMKDRVRTIALYADQVKGKCAIAGWVEGAVAEYCDLRNINQAMMDLAMEEEYLEQVLDRITEQAIIYIKEQIKAGADIIGVGDAACSLVGPQLYEKYGFPYEKRMIDAIHQGGARAKLHICGNTAPILPKIRELGVDIFDLDWMVDYKKAVELLRDVSAVNGNFDPVAVLKEGNVPEIQKTVKERMEIGDRRSLISAGCEVPRDTPVENLLAVSEAIRNFNQR